jgi:hypothetical protein
MKQLMIVIKDLLDSTEAMIEVMKSLADEINKTVETASHIDSYFPQMTDHLETIVGLAMPIATEQRQTPVVPVVKQPIIKPAEIAVEVIQANKQAEFIKNHITCIEYKGKKITYYNYAKINEAETFLLLDAIIAFYTNEYKGYPAETVKGIKEAFGHHKSGTRDLLVLTNLDDTPNPDPIQKKFLKMKTLGGAFVCGSAAIKADLKRRLSMGVLNLIPGTVKTINFILEKGEPKESVKDKNAALEYLYQEALRLGI